MRLLLPIGLILIAALGCGSKNTNAESVKHYHLTGKITALDTQNQIVTVDQAAIPNWMEAMTMEYPIKSKSEFQSLHVGEKIQGTVNLHGAGDYDLSNIQPQSSGK